MNPWVGLVVWGTVCVGLVTAIVTGIMRGRYKIQAPAITGHPMFERAYRVQMNTLEQTVMFLPAFLLAVQFGRDDIACVLGGVWLLARIRARDARLCRAADPIGLGPCMALHAGLIETGKICIGLPNSGVILPASEHW